MGNPTGVAIIGTGGIAEAHLFAYQKEAERATIVALVDLDLPRAKAAAEKFGIESVCEDYREVLMRNDVEAISICTPPFTHVEIACESLRAGKHVLCEKPVAPALARLDAIEEAQKATGRVFSGVFQLRFGRGAQQLRLLLDEGKFGRLHLGLAETLWFRDDDYYNSVPWRGKWSTEAGGATVSQAIHLIDLLLWYFGEPESVFAEAGVFRTPTEADDVSVAVIRFKNSAIGQLTSTVSAFGEERSRVEICGSELAAVSQGSAYSATWESPYWNPHIGRPFERPPVDGYWPPEHPLVGVERHFRLTAAMQETFPDLAVVGSGYSWLRHYAASAGEANVRAGRVSIVGLGRGAIAYPDFAADLMEHGEMVDRKSCIGVSYCTALMRAKNNELGQFPVGCVPRDPLFAEQFKLTHSSAVPAR